MRPTAVGGTKAFGIAFLGKANIIGNQDWEPVRKRAVGFLNVPYLGNPPD
jgi:hypothetical protein